MRWTFKTILLWLVFFAFFGFFDFWGVTDTMDVLADTQSDYTRAQAYIAKHHFVQKMNASLQKATSTLPTAPHNPDQATYYRHSDAMNQNATTSVVASNTVGNIVRNDALTRPKMTVNKNSPEVHFSQTIQNHANAIADGTYKDCNKKTIWGITYTHKACSTGRPFQLDCVKTRNIKVQERTVIKKTTISLPVHIHMTGSFSAYVSMPVKKGVVTGISIHVKDGSEPWSCFRTYHLAINGVDMGAYQGHCGKYLGDLQFSRGGLTIPFTHHTVTLSLMRGRLSGYASGSLAFTYSVKEKKVIKTWASSCAPIHRSCHLIKTHCLEPSSTKTVEGVRVSSHCWKAQESYQCGSPRSSDCKALENEGCTQMSSQCAQQEMGSCEYYDETWVCPDKKTMGTGIQCGEQFYCMDGSCQPTQHEKNHQFGKSVTQLDAVASAGQEIEKQGADPKRDPNSIRIFSGHSAHCREVVLGTLNCCKDRGWAKGIFADCNAQEKALGQAKEQGGFVISVGRYCRAHILGLCTEHNEGYCIFPSRIAYDIQKYGRYKQLKKGFGEGKHPDCSGLSPGEMGKINFALVDFSNVVSLVTGKAKWPDQNQSNSNIEKQIREAIARKLHD